MTTFLGTTDVALRLRCSSERVRQLEKAGKLPAEKMPNGRRVFRTEDVERFAEERARLVASPNGDKAEAGAR